MLETDGPLQTQACRISIACRGSRKRAVRLQQGRSRPVAPAALSAARQRSTATKLNLGSTEGPLRVRRGCCCRRRRHFLRPCVWAVRLIAVMYQQFYSSQHLLVQQQPSCRSSRPFGSSQQRRRQRLHARPPWATLRTASRAAAAPRMAATSKFQALCLLECPVICGMHGRGYVAHKA